MKDLLDDGFFFRAISFILQMEICGEIWKQKMFSLSFNFNSKQDPEHFFLPRLHSTFPQLVFKSPSPPVCEST